MLMDKPADDVSKIEITVAAMQVHVATDARAERGVAGPPNAEVMFFR